MNNHTGKQASPLVFQALGCVYSACDFSDCICGCKGKSQLLCLTREVACALGEPTTGCGMVTNKDNKEFCKLGCLFCSYGCKEPETCMKGAVQVCCIKEAAALPLDREYVGEPVCALYCLSCLPKCGCCVEAPRCPAFEKPVFDYGPVLSSEEMDRGIGMVKHEPYADEY